MTSTAMRPFLASPAAISAIFSGGFGLGGSFARSRLKQTDSERATAFPTALRIAADRFFAFANTSVSSPTGFASSGFGVRYLSKR